MDDWDWLRNLVLIHLLCICRPGNSRWWHCAAVSFLISLVVTFLPRTRLHHRCLLLKLLTWMEERTLLISTSSTPTTFLLLRCLTRGGSYVRLFILG